MHYLPRSVSRIIVAYLPSALQAVNTSDFTLVISAGFEVELVPVSVICELTNQQLSSTD